MSEPIVVYPGDCLDLLKTIPNDSLKLIVTSPPYNIGKEYERRLKLESYIEQLDVGVEILPMKFLQSHMSSGVRYYEGEFYNVLRQGRGVPAVPLSIIGIAP